MNLDLFIKARDRQPRRRRGPFFGTRSGAVILIQRFGSVLNLNIHLHMLFLDGAYTFRGKRANFHRARRPTSEALHRLLDTLSQ